MTTTKEAMQITRDMVRLVKNRQNRGLDVMPDIQILEKRINIQSEHLEKESAATIEQARRLKGDIYA